MKQVTWTQGGREITVKVASSQLTLLIDGKYSISTGMIERPQPKDRAMYAQRGAYGNIGSVVIYNERAQELMAIQAEQEAELAAKAALIAPLLKLEARVEQAEKAIRDMRDNPAPAYAALSQAIEAVDVWKAANPELWAKEAAFRKQVASDARWAATGRRD